MRYLHGKTVVLTGLLLAFGLGCMDRPPATMCPVPTEFSETEFKTQGYDGVDMVVVVDNSSSMKEEQKILGTSFFTLINSLVNPLEGSAFKLNNMRIAVINTDMGFSADDEGYDKNEGWHPNGTYFDVCAENPFGDGAVFLKSATTVDILDDQILCTNNSHCPEDWPCENGRCQTPMDTANANVNCPDLGEPWAATTSEEHNGDLSLNAACMSQVDIKGCGYEQQLGAAAMVFSDKNEEQKDFIVDSHLLMYLIVSDEEDCSLADTKEFFKSEAMEDKFYNVACGRNENLLLDIDHFHNRFTGAKEKDPNAVLFAAIVGVPKHKDCNGTGVELENCLAHESMQKVELDANNPGDVHYQNACERGEVTKAKPGRRYVKLAQKFKEKSYIYSICEEDWSPAMTNIANMIADNITGACFSDKLGWDAATETAACNVVVSFEGVDECPPEYEEESIEKTTVDGDTITVANCILPKFSAPLDCAAVDESEFEGEFGWYYCENYAENHKDACNDGLDNDNDGLVDCKDDECGGCCADGEFDGTLAGCETSCTYEVSLTDIAVAKIGQNSVFVDCLQEFNFEDKNCQENTALSCNDQLDNDGNGSYDWNTVSREELLADDPDLSEEELRELAHLADPNCCPLRLKEGSDRCDIDADQVNEIALDEDGDESDFGPDGSEDQTWPDACVIKARQIGCALPQ